MSKPSRPLGGVGRGRTQSPTYTVWAKPAGKTRDSREGLSSTMRSPAIELGVESGACDVDIDGRARRITAGLAFE